MAPDWTSFSGPVWRILFAADAAAACDPVPSPEGRFHHDGEAALYASLSVEGADVAIRRYLTKGDPARIIVRLAVTADRLADLRDHGTTPSAVWQDQRANGQPAPTWALSDAARAAGAQGMLYRSRSRPDLIHLVLFRWNCPDGATLHPAGPPARWTPHGSGTQSEART
jgi:hypothetical protein